MFTPSGGETNALSVAGSKAPPIVRNTITSNRVIAADYANYGIPVFPCDETPNPKDPSKPSKAPLPCITSLRKDATTDLKTIRKWFDKRPNALVAARCEDMKVFVVDPDIRDNKQGVENFAILEQKYGRIENAVRVRTVSGGRHVILKKPEGLAVGNSPGLLPPGIDIRGDGGYIILPGTQWVHGGGWELEEGSEQLYTAISEGTLAEAPQWLLDIISGKIDERPLSLRAQATVAQRSEPVTHDGSDVERRYIEEALRYVPSDDRDTWLKIGGALHDTGHTWARSLWDDWSRTSSKFNAKDQETTWRSFDRPAVVKASVGTIIALARANGFDGHKFERVATIESGETQTPSLVVNDPQQPSSSATKEQKLTLNPSPFVYRDPSKIPPREILYDGHFIRSFVSGTVAPGGSGKTALLIAEALSMATGVPILGHKPVHRLKVYYFNGEDPAVETERRVAALIKHHNLDPKLVEENFFLDSGRDTPIKIAHLDSKTGFSIAVPVSNALIEAFVHNKIDVAIFDPYISTHAISENDNNQNDAVVKEWGRIAGMTNCAIELVHHTRKNGGNETTGEDARGAKSFSDGLRSLRSINTMTKAECGLAQVPETARRAYFRVGNEKANMKAASEASWFRLTSVKLGNATDLYPDGDDVAAVEPFKLPSLLDGISVGDLRTAQRVVAKGNYRASPQANDWAGHAIGAVIGINTKEAGAKKRMKEILDVWTANGMFKIVEEKDKNSTLRPMLRVGKAANDD